MTQSQPLGAFAFPAGMMLLPESSLASPAAEALRNGHRPERWPTELRAHALAHAGDFDAAVAALDNDDALSRYNRYALTGVDLHPAAVISTLPAGLKPVADVLRFTLGDLAQPPAEVKAGDPVVAALVLAARASAALEAGAADGAASLLRRASAQATTGSSALTAVLLGNAGSVTFEHAGNRAAARADLTEAAAQLTGTDLVLSKAELHLQLGMLEHEDAVAADLPLTAAMHHYYTTLQLVTAESAPHLWASAQLNLATAYLASPMVEASDVLRMGIAIQALRAALRIFTRDSHGAEWSSATLNLANALIYTPSVKQGDNLVEAVELYEQLLELRDRDGDPLGRARVLTNQGNALAHLGVFDQATAKLSEARFLFEEHLDSRGALTVRGLLDEIVKQTTPEDGRGAGGRLALGGVGEVTRAPQPETAERPHR